MRTRILLPHFLFLFAIIFIAENALAERVLQSGHSRVKIFSWDNLGIEGIEPIPYARARAEHSWRIFYPGRTGAYHIYRPPEVLAEEMATRLRELPVGSRHLFINGYGEGCDPAIVRPVEYPKCIAVGGSYPDEILNNLGFILNEDYKYTEPYDLTWLKAFLKSLAGHGVQPDQIVLDYEMGLSYWHIKPRFSNDESGTVALENFFRDVYARHREQLPSSLQHMTPVDFARYWQRPNGRTAVIEWNKFTTKLRAEVMGYYVREAYEYAYGTNAPFALNNYGDMKLTRNDLREFNNWPVPADAAFLAGTHASPVLYSWVGTRHGTLTGDYNYSLMLQDKKDFLDDNIRAFGGDASKVNPWITMYSVHGVHMPDIHVTAAFNRELIEHAYNGGVRTFYLFELNSSINVSDPAEAAIRRESLQDLVSFLRQPEPIDTPVIDATVITLEEETPEEEVPQVDITPIDHEPLTPRDDDVVTQQPPVGPAPTTLTPLVEKKKVKTRSSSGIKNRTSLTPVNKRVVQQPAANVKLQPAIVCENGMVGVACDESLTLTE
jgi:hypothetical protein